VTGIESEVTFFVTVESIALNPKAFASAKIGFNDIMNDIDLSHFEIIGEGTERSEIW
jgi:hypothetical protein